MKFAEFCKTTRGNKTAKVKRFLYYEKGIKTCCICGELITPKQLTAEHVTPKSKGGGGGLANISVSHRKCNFDRGNTPFGLLKRVVALKHWYDAETIMVRTIKDI